MIFNTFKSPAQLFLAMRSHSGKGHNCFGKWRCSEKILQDWVDSLSLSAWEHLAKQIPTARVTKWTVWLIWATQTMKLIGEIKVLNFTIKQMGWLPRRVQMFSAPGEWGYLYYLWSLLSDCNLKWEKWTDKWMNEGVRKWLERLMGRQGMTSEI